MRVLKVAIPSLVVLLAIVPSAAARSSANDIVPGRYIVTFDNSVSSVSRETASLERQGGFDAKFVYGHALRGFAAGLNQAQVRELKTDPSVASVVPDRYVHATA